MHSIYRFADPKARKWDKVGSPGFWLRLWSAFLLLLSSVRDSIVTLIILPDVLISSIEKVLFLVKLVL